MSVQWYVRLADGFKFERRNTPWGAWNYAIERARLAGIFSELDEAKLVRVTKSTKKRDATRALHRAVEAWATPTTSGDVETRTYVAMTKAAGEWREAMRFGK